MEQGFGWIDWLIIAAYMGVMLWIGGTFQGTQVLEP